MIPGSYFGEVSITSNHERTPVYCAGCGFPIMSGSWLVQVKRKGAEKSFQLCYGCFKTDKAPKD